jgi:Tol biopolymer transport system component
VGQACGLFALVSLLGFVPDATSGQHRSGVARASNGDIVFVSELGFGLDIYISEPHGTVSSRAAKLTRLTSEGENIFPTWSPSGTEIAFSARRGRDLNFGIFLISPNGRRERRLSAGGDFKPTWSPDGTKIAFARGNQIEFDIWVMNADGTGQVRLTHHPAREGGPAWSPDGRRIAYVSNKYGNEEIHVMSANGADELRLTFTPGPDADPAWSPDGRQILFRSDRDGNREIYVMNADGSNQRRLTRDPAVDARPAWAPDGQHILFDRVRDPQLEGPDIWSMTPSGRNARKLIDDGGSKTNEDAEWQPAPDLAVRPSFSKRQVQVGGEIRYSLRVLNRSSVPAIGVTVRHSLAGVKVVRTRPARCRRSRTLVCAFPRVTFGTSVEVKVEGRVLRPGLLHHTTSVQGRVKEGSLLNNRASGWIRASKR